MLQTESLVFSLYSQILRNLVVLLRTKEYIWCVSSSNVVVGDLGGIFRYQTRGSKGDNVLR